MNREAIKRVEQDLRNYPLWLLNVELPGLGHATDWTQVYVKMTNKSSLVESIMIDNEETERKVSIITGVLRQLSELQKTIIEEKYFRDIVTKEEVLNKYSISLRTYYRERKIALNKFVVAL